MPGLDWLTARPVAHRGLHDAQRGIVENTASAFSAAIAGRYAIECDLQLAGDGEAMVFHDGRVVRGKWSKDDLDAQLQLSTAAGELELPPGKVWIELVPAATGDVTLRK